MTKKDHQKIKNVIEDAYIHGIHETQDQALIDEGFHPAFEMLALTEQEVARFDVPSWLSRIDSMKQENPELWEAQTRFEFKVVDASGTAAVAKLEVYKGGQFFSTDYMLLYKIDGTWKIVSKVFTVDKEE